MWKLCLLVLHRHKEHNTPHEGTCLVSFPIPALSRHPQLPLVCSIHFPKKHLTLASTVLRKPVGLTKRELLVRPQYCEKKNTEQLCQGAWKLDEELSLRMEMEKQGKTFKKEDGMHITNPF